MIRGCTIIVRMAAALIAHFAFWGEKYDWIFCKQMLNTLKNFDKMCWRFGSVYGSSDRLFWDSDHRFSALSVSGSAKWCGKGGKIDENCGKNNFFYHRKVEKHRTSLRQTSVLLWQNIGTFCQRSPMFCFFRWKTCRNSPFQVCVISDLPAACCLPKPFPGPFRSVCNS